MTAGRVLVTDAERGSALAIIRSLGRAGWDVVAAGTDRGSPGFRSRHAHHRVRYPRPENGHDRFVDALHHAVERLSVDLVIPVTDAVIVPLSLQRTRFAGLATLALPDHDALERARDKLATLELAASVGVPTPAWEPVHTPEEAEAASGRIGFPIVLKPFQSRSLRDDGTIESFSVSYANDRAGLCEQMRRLEGRTTVLLQAYTPGAGVGVGVLADRGSIVAAFQHRRIHEVPITGGASGLRESVPLDPPLLEQTAALMRGLEWTGLAMVEFKVGPDGPRLMEINGRAWGSLPLAVASGVDFPALLAERYAGVERRAGTDGHEPTAALAPTSPPGYQLGVRCRDLGLEITWIGSVLLSRRRYPFIPVPPRIEGLKGIAGLFDPRVQSDTFSRDDPAPGLADIVRVARHLVSKVLSRAS